MKQVKLHDKEFKVSISGNEIQEAIVKMAKKINADYKDKETPLFISILNGSFMFTADLFKHIDFVCEVTFLKLTSYRGTASTGAVRQLIGVNESIEGRDVIVLEDIVDTGITLEQILGQLKSFEPSSVRVASLLFKPEAYQKDLTIDYIGMEIPNDFIVGYGLDYDGLGRNLPDIYSLIS
ncbi:MAG: hypoxanthine phosphoribosyltransferase [Marinilabiliales bacterium]|nr:MAG: hypoxanthine phosphoribosyltransferase [Marinilabiliales bacterium]